MSSHRLNNFLPKSAGVFENTLVTCYRCWFYLYIAFSFTGLIVGTVLCPEMQSNITANITISLRVINLGLIKVNSFSVAFRPKSGQGYPFLKFLHQPQTHALRRTPLNQTSATDARIPQDSSEPDISHRRTHSAGLL